MRRQLALLTSAVGLAVALVACGSDGNGDAGPSPSRPTTPAAVDTTLTPTTSPPTTAPPGPTTTTPAPGERLSPASRLRVDGIGPVRVGMTLAEARAAAGVTLELTTTEHCRSLQPAGSDPFVTLIATAPGEVVDVISAGPGTATVSGVRIGSTEQDVLAAYGERADVVNPGERVHRVVYRATDPALRAYALVFGIGDGRVTSMHAGTDVVLADELCA
jgi:hypothetical protein